MDTSIEMCNEAIRHKHYFGLAHLTLWLLSGSNMGLINLKCLKRMRLAQQITKEKTCSLYMQLVQELGDDESEVEFPNGTKMTKKETCAEAIRSDRNCYEAHLTYASLWKVQQEGVGSIFTAQILNIKKSALLEALRCNPKGHEAYQLSLLMTNQDQRDETIELKDGSRMTRQELLVEAVKCSGGTCGEAYRLLAECCDTDTQILIDGEAFTKVRLFVQSLKCEPKNSQSYAALAKILSPTGETVLLWDGRTVNSEWLLIEAIRYSPIDANLYCLLGRAMQPGSAVVLARGHKINGRRRAFKKAIQFDENCANAYFGLALCLDPDEEYNVPGIGMKSRAKIFSIAKERKPRLSLP